MSERKETPLGPKIYWSKDKPPECQCRVITSGPAGGSLTATVAPGPAQPGFGPNTLVGKSSRTDWTPNFSLENPLPCQLLFEFPPQPPAAGVNFATFATAGPFGLRTLFATSSAKVVTSIKGAYHIQPKERKGVLTATLDATLTGVQYLGGAIGNASATLLVTLDVQPFGTFVLKAPFSAPNGSIASVARKLPVPAPGGGIKFLNVPAQSGQTDPFTAKLARRRAAVPCCKPQKFTVDTVVSVKRTNLFGAVSSITALTFQIQAPDPPDDIAAKVVPLEVRTVIEAAPVEPKPVQGVRVKRVLDEKPPRWAAMTSDGDSLVLARQNGSGRDGDPLVSTLVRFDPSTGDLAEVAAKGLIAVSRLRSLTLPGDDAPRVVALDFGAPLPGTSAPSQGDGRIVAIDAHGRVSPLFDSLDLVSDAATFHFGGAAYLTVPTLMDGALFKWDGKGELELLGDCFATPIALAAPPAGSDWKGGLYLSEAGSFDEEVPVSISAGRIVEVDLHNHTTRSFLEGLTAKAIVFPAVGAYKGDMLVTTGNEVDPATGEGIANTGEVLRVRPDGGVSTLLFLDDPYDIAVNDSGRCFVLAEGGVYEIAGEPGDA